MMLTYNSTFAPPPPQAMPAAPFNSPYEKFGSTHGDLLRARMGENNAKYNIARSRAMNDYAMQAQQAQRELALQGLQNQAVAQQNQNSLMNERVGIVSGLLSGLFK